MKECAGNFFILNGNIASAVNFSEDFIYNGESVYEILRIINGVPTFFYDHMERLKASVNSIGKKMLADIPTIKDAVIELINIENKRHSNIKIVFNYNGTSSFYSLYFVETSYPGIDQYKNGVKGILFYGERKDPGSKVIDRQLRSAINDRLRNEEAYEALLVNEKNEITEGSRSNIFFMKNERLVTAPDNVILNGITRKNLLKICTENNIEVDFRCVSAAEIMKYDAVFMTGTSPVALPFCCIGDSTFKTDSPMIEKLRELYFEKAAESILHFKGSDFRNLQ